MTVKAVCTNQPINLKVPYIIGCLARYVGHCRGYGWSKDQLVVVRAVLRGDEILTCDLLVNGLCDADWVFVTSVGAAAFERPVDCPVSEIELL